MNISLIAAIDENYGIGKNNQLLCHLSKDLKWFKEQTKNFTVVMGRKTYEQIYSIYKKPLPQRVNVVLSKNTKKEKFNTYEIINDFYFFQNQTDLINYFHSNEKLFIIGGASIYELFLPLANELIITKIHKKFDADVYFPKWDSSLFKETFIQNEEENGISFSFHIYQKNIAL